MWQLTPLSSNDESKSLISYQSQLLSLLFSYFLLVPKKEHPLYRPDRPLSSHVPVPALKAAASERLQVLARPKPRKPLFEGFDPYKVSSAARAATASPRTQELSLPLVHKCVTKAAQDKYEHKDVWYIYIFMYIYNKCIRIRLFTLSY